MEDKTNVTNIYIYIYIYMCVCVCIIIIFIIIYLINIIINTLQEKYQYICINTILMKLILEGYPAQFTEKH